VQVEPFDGRYFEGVGRLVHVRERNFRRRFRTEGVGGERPRGTTGSVSGVGCGFLTDSDAIVKRHEERVGVYLPEYGRGADIPILVGKQRNHQQ